MNAADAVLRNGFVYTVDPSASVAEAVAVRDGRIAFVGSDTDVEPMIGPGTEIIDLAGKMVLPAFIDSHMHTPEGALFALYEVTLPEGIPFEEYLPTIKKFAEAHPELPAIRGAGWDDSRFASLGPPKELLDEAVPDRPAVIRSCSLHSVWCNSVALERAGITRDTPSPEYGIVEKDPVTGEPTGTLHESALDLVLPQLPPYSQQQHVTAYAEFLRTVTGPCGITGCFDARITLNDTEAMEAIAQLEREGRLTARIRAGLLIDPRESLKDQLERAVAIRAKYTGPLFTVESVKFFADGSGYSVYLHEPFSTIPAGYPDGYRGYPGWDAEALAAAAVTAAELGFRLHFHAIGDAAATMSLDAIQAAQQRVGRKDIRAAITHLFLLSERDTQRLVDLEVVAVLQPVWMQRDAYYYQGYLPQLGEARCNKMMPLRSLFDRGILVASSTDFPITNPPSPLDGIATGVLRWHPLLSAPGDVWTPAECADLPQMIRSYTINGAKANFLEDETGSIEVGKSADLLVLNENILDVPAERIGFRWMGSGTTKVLMTMFQGKMVYRESENR